MISFLDGFLTAFLIEVLGRRVDYNQVSVWQSNLSTPSLCSSLFQSPGLSLHHVTLFLISHPPLLFPLYCSSPLLPPWPFIPHPLLFSVCAQLCSGNEIRMIETNAHEIFIWNNKRSVNAWGMNVPLPSTLNLALFHQSKWNGPYHHSNLHWLSLSVSFSLPLSFPTFYLCQSGCYYHIMSPFFPSRYFSFPLPFSFLLFCSSFSQH